MSIIVFKVNAINKRFHMYYYLKQYINYSVYVFQVDKMSDNVKQYSCNGYGYRKSLVAG